MKSLLNGSLSKNSLMDPMDVVWSSTISDFLNENFFDPSNAEVEEYKDHYLLKLEVPGFGRKHLDVNIQDDILFIKGEKQNSVKDYNGNTQDFATSSFVRSFKLPGGVDLHRTKARCKNGILSIKVYKEKPKRIKIITVNGRDNSDGLIKGRYRIEKMFESLKNNKWLRWCN